MAENEASIDLAAAIPETDYADRRHMYLGFLRLAKYAVGFVALVLILMAIFLA